MYHHLDSATRVHLAAFYICYKPLLFMETMDISRKMYNFPSFTLSTVLCLCLVMACSQEQQKYPQEPPTVKARAPHSITSSPSLSVSGTLQATTTVHLAFQLAGKIEEIDVSEGNRVSKGQQLAKLDDSSLQNNLIIAEAKLKEVQNKHARLATLYKRGSLTITDMDKIDAALAENLAATENIKKQLNDAILLSPINGVVARKFAEAGSIATPGSPVLDVVEVDQIKAVLSIPESDVSLIHSGQQVTLRLPANQRHIFNSIIDELLPVADSLTRSYEATCLLNNDKNLLFPGSVILATILLDGKTEILTIPGESVLISPDGVKYVYILTENRGSVRRKQIATKGFFKKEVVVSQGVKDDDLIIIAGQKRLSDGAIVNLMQDTKAQ